MVTFVQHLLTSAGASPPQRILPGNNKRVGIVFACISGNVFIELYASGGTDISTCFFDSQSISSANFMYRDYGPLIQSEISIGHSGFGASYNITEIIDDRFNEEYGITWR